MRDQDDPEIIRNRAENAARLAADAYPAAIEMKRQKFSYWNGDPPAPQITHWTNRGTFAIRGHTPRKTTSVLFNGKHLGFGSDVLSSVAESLFQGAYNKELGFPASDLIPPTLHGWNDLGG